MKTCGNFVGDFFFFFSLSNSFQVSMALEIEFKLSNTMVLNSYIEAEAGKTTSCSRIFITKIIFGLGNIHVCIVSMYLLFRNSRRTRRRIEIELSLEGGGIFYPGKQKVRLVEVVR